MNNLYIIGGSGFIGKNMVRCYYKQYKILVVDKFIDADYFKQYPEVETLQLDLAAEMIPASYPTPDFIINLASIVTAERDLSLFDGMIQSNNSPYALVKQLTTNTALMLHQNYGFPAMVVRPGNLFGPLQHPSKFIPYVLNTLRRNETLNVTPCEQKRDFIYADDFAALICPNKRSA